MCVQFCKNWEKTFVISNVFRKAYNKNRILCLLIDTLFFKFMFEIFLFVFLVHIP